MLAKLKSIFWVLFSWGIGGLSLLVQRFVYRPWSFLWRTILEHKFSNVPITPNRKWKIKELLNFYMTCTWVKDPWYYIDVISKPEKFFMTLKGDCDEFAAFAGRVLSKEKYPGYIMSVTWYDKEQKQFGGHNVFLFQDGDSLYHIGNWGLKGPFDSKEEAIKSVLLGRFGITYGLREPDSLKWVQGGCLRSINKNK